MKQLISRIDDELWILPPVPLQRPPSLNEVLEANRGCGSAVSGALRAEREAR